MSYLVPYIKQTQKYTDPESGNVYENNDYISTSPCQTFYKDTQLAEQFTPYQDLGVSYEWYCPDPDQSLKILNDPSTDAIGSKFSWVVNICAFAAQNLKTEGANCVKDIEDFSFSDWSINTNQISQYYDSKAGS